MRLVYLLATYTTRGGLSGNRSEPSTDQGGIELRRIVALRRSWRDVIERANLWSSGRRMQRMKHYGIWSELVSTGCWLLTSKPS